MISGESCKKEYVCKCDQVNSSGSDTFVENGFYRTEKKAKEWCSGEQNAVTTCTLQ